MVFDTALARVLEYRDESVPFTRDLFAAVNGKWLDSYQIPDDLPSDGSFMRLHIEAEEHVQAIIEEISQSTPQAGSNEEKIARLYRSWMDTDALNANGTTPLHAQSEKIDAASTKDELAHVAASFLPRGVASFFDFDVDSDLNDPNRYTVFVGQSGIGLPDESYYREEQWESVRESYLDFLPRYFAAAYDLDEKEAQRWRERAYALEEKFAATHMNVVDKRNTDNINNPMSWADFVARTPGFPWEEVAGVAGFTPEQNVLVMHCEALSKSAQVWEEASLEDLKIYMKLRLLNAYAHALTPEIDELRFSFYGRVLSGQAVQRSREKRGVQLVDGAMGEAVGKVYVQRYFPASHKEKMLELVGDLLEAYKRSISSLTWMSEETKAKALEKLATFNPKIGYPDQWRDYSSLLVTDSLFENMANISQFEWDRALAKLKKPVDRHEWFMTPQTVNAYYNPVWNEIVFPAAILQFPFFDPDRDAALNYGGIGAVIGHEIGHGFDDQGSKYGPDGALMNWWTDDDRREFEARTKALIAQYDALVPAQLGPDGPHVQGALTLGENIGDLGGLSIGLKAYEIYLERQGLDLSHAPVIDGFSGAARVFLSYARIWQFKARDEQAKLRIATDPHSPAEFRCNQVVKNVDAFAEAFGVVEGDELYLDPSERVHIW